jgi:ABC-2 type transport system ATP-binding protein
VLRAGSILASGRPDGISSGAAGHTFRTEPVQGEPARHLQSRLLNEMEIVDAVPEGGSVRLVTAEPGSPGKIEPLLKGIPVVPVNARFEDGFMMLLRQNTGVMLKPSSAMPQGGAVEDRAMDTVIEVHDLVRRFGSFTAVDHISFEVRRGTIFGLLGPNGAGKTTTFRMLCGLLPATAGKLRVSGVDLHKARASARQRIGYVAQKFSLYGQLSALENLDFFASAYGLHGARKRDRIDWALQAFELKSLMHLASGQLPGGYKQRLAMAAALLHEPEILFLDEPTSGVDPVARREFWQRITFLAERQVTVVVTTHFMEEAEYCDRIVILDAGRVLAEGTPAEIRAHAPPVKTGEAGMEDAFIAIVEKARDRTPMPPSSVEGRP